MADLCYSSLYVFNARLTLWRHGFMCINLTRCKNETPDHWSLITDHWVTSAAHFLHKHLISQSSRPKKKKEKKESNVPNSRAAQCAAPNPRCVYRHLAVMFKLWAKSYSFPCAPASQLVENGQLTLSYCLSASQASAITLGFVRLNRRLEINNIESSK